ncbi:MAG: O-antigen ligase family protein [Chloroflexales bacterium]|nr:O-antigen ligase family protein [Chloroflexales bacterium]
MFISEIPLSLFEQILIALLLMFFALTGRLPWVLGFQLSTTLWTRTFFLGPIPNVYPTVIALAVAAGMDWHLRRRFPVPPPLYRGAIIWFGLWWLWMVLLLVIFDPEGARSWMIQLFIYMIFPVTLISQYDWTVQRIREFAVSYVLVTLYGGWKALALLGIDLSYLISDPTLSKTSILRLELINYHWFSYCFALALLLTIGLLIQTRRRPLVSLLLAANAVICVYFLFMAGSRQAMNGAIIVSAMMCLWALFSGKGPRGVILAVAATVTSVFMWIYTVAPHLLLRDDADASSLFDIFSDRGQYWRIGWNNFLSSPVWGTGWVWAVYTHNLFISVLTDQGVVGMFFFIGVLVFIMWQLKGVLRGVGSTEIAAFRITFFGIVLFTMIHSMASGNSLSIWYFFWAGAFLWVLRGMVDKDLAAAAQAHPSFIWGSRSGEPLLHAPLPPKGRWLPPVS